MAVSTSESRFKQATAQSAFLQTDKGQAINSAKGSHMAAVRDQEKTNHLAAEARERQRASNSLLPDVEELKQELLKSNWEAVAWKYTVVTKNLESKVKELNRKNVAPLQSVPVMNIEAMNVARCLGFSLKYLVLLHATPVVPGDLAAVLMTQYGTRVANVQHDKDFGKAAAILGESRDDWLSASELRALVEMSSCERVARIFFQQSGGAMSKEGALDEWRSFVNLTMNGEPWPDKSSWRPKGISTKSACKRGFSGQSTTVAVSPPLPLAEDVAVEVEKVVEEIQLLPYEEDFMPPMAIIAKAYHNSGKQTAKIAWDLAVTPTFLQQEVGIGWAPTTGAAYILNSFDPVSRFVDAGFQAALCAIAAPEPVTAGAVIHAAKIVKKKYGTVIRTDQGKAAELGSLSRETWFTRTEVKELVASLAGDRRRFAAILFQQSGATALRTDSRRQKRWILWKNFVDAECDDIDWVGLSLGSSSWWCPMMLLTDEDVDVCFNHLVDQFHTSTGIPRPSKPSSVSSSSSSAVSVAVCVPALTDAVDKSGGGDVDTVEQNPKKKLKGGQCKKIADSREEILAEIHTHYPNVTVQEAVDDETWRAAIVDGKNSKLNFSCSECGARVQRMVKNVRSGAAPICACHQFAEQQQHINEEGDNANIDDDCSDLIVQSADEMPVEPMARGATRTSDISRLRSVLHPRYIVDNFHHKQMGNWKKPQNQLSMTTTCQRCGLQTDTVVKNVLGGSSPACWCTGQVPWKGENGYQHILEIIEEQHSTRFHTMTADLAWWVGNVKTLNSKVPLQCSLCNVVKNVRISDIQQGIGGIGCHCVLKGAFAVKNWLEELTHPYTWEKEFPVIRSRATSRILHVDLAFGESAPGDLSVLLERMRNQTPSSSLIPATNLLPVFIEIDGGQHFTLCYNGLVDDRYMRRDYEKEVAVMQRPAVLIRVSHTTVMTTGTGWKDYLLDALHVALVQSEGCVIHEPLPCYCDATDSFYVRLRQHTESLISSPFQLGNENGRCVYRRCLVPSS